MANYNIQGNRLAKGVNSAICVNMENENGPANLVIGLVDTWEVNESLTVDRAECLGEILPVSLDITGVSVQVNLGGFIPAASLLKDGVATQDGTMGGGGLTLKALNPTEESMLDNQSLAKIPYLEIRDKKLQSIFGSSKWLIPSSYRESGQGKGYHKVNLTLEGIGYENGPDYGAVL